MINERVVSKQSQYCDKEHFIELYYNKDILEFVFRYPLDCQGARGGERVDFIGIIDHPMTIKEVREFACPTPTDNEPPEGWTRIGGEAPAGFARYSNDHSKFSGDYRHGIYKEVQQ